MNNPIDSTSLEDYIPVFNFKPNYGTNNGLLVCKGSIQKDSKLKDTDMELDTDMVMIKKYGKNVFHVTDIDKYVVIGKMYSCNINGGYMLESDRFPIFYMSIVYEKQFVTGFLFSIFVYFKLDEECRKKLDTPRKYMEGSLDGKYYVEILADENFIKKIKVRIEDNIITQLITQNPDKSLEEFVDTVAEQVENKIKSYEDILKPTVLNRYPNKNLIIDKYMKGVCRNKNFLEMIDLGVKIRDDERRSGGKNTTFTFEPPKRIFDLKNLHNDPDKIAELLSNDEFDRSDTDSDSD